jgi:amino acid adenylation domain-containing protein
VGQGDVVGIVAARRGCLVVAVLATLHCGAAFSLLNPEYPIERVALLSEILQPACLLFAGIEDDFDQGLRERLAALRDCLFVPAQKNALALALALAPAADFVPASVTPDQLACITFTSGTTGTPKAVGGIHIGLAGYLTWVPQWLDITPADRFSLFSGLGHDPIQRDMFGPLCNGATLYIPDAEVFAPHLLARWLKEQRITFAHMTPAMAQILCTTDETRFEDLRVTFLTGELLHSDAVRKLLGYNPSMRVLNSYGTTETQRAVTYFEASLNPARPGVVPAGASAPDAVIRVLNPQGTTCDYGEIGDLFIESFHLSRGYRNDPELTAKVMTDLGGGLRRYRTGDIGCRLPDRTVMCLGRRDSQVNIRGFRIETGEIEAQARALRNVKDVVVLPVRRDETQDLALVAYVVPADPRQPERELRRALAAHLKQTLPAYMVPSATVVLAQLPITPNGKLDRGALPPPRWGDADNYVAPVGELEIALADIWAEVLRIERVGALDNFFDIGGHSMLMVLMATTVKRRLAQKFNLGEMLRCQTIREQAALLARTARP